MNDFVGGGGGVVVVVAGAATAVVEGALPVRAGVASSDGRERGYEGI